MFYLPVDVERATALGFERRSKVLLGKEDLPNFPIPLSVVTALLTLDRISEHAKLREI